MSGLDSDARSTSVVDKVFDKAAKPASSEHQEFFDVISDPSRSFDDVVQLAKDKLAREKAPGFGDPKESAQPVTAQKPSAHEAWFNVVRNPSQSMDDLVRGVNERLGLRPAKVQAASAPISPDAPEL